MVTPYKLLGEVREIRQATQGNYKDKFLILQYPSARWRMPFDSVPVFTNKGDFSSPSVLSADTPEELIELARPWGEPAMTIEELEYLEVEGW